MIKELTIVGGPNIRYGKWFYLNREWVYCRNGFRIWKFHIQWFIIIVASSCRIVFIDSNPHLYRRLCCSSYPLSLFPSTDHGGIPRTGSRTRRYSLFQPGNELEPLETTKPRPILHFLTNDTPWNIRRILICQFSQLLKRQILTNLEKLPHVIFQLTTLLISPLALGIIHVKFPIFISARISAAIELTLNLGPFLTVFNNQ
mmetsp:Transcript_23551/g.34870  ORF Transcript_23551/g.34870 Transcript_23551/m.34870 type:complete len:201 (+) Transcript_23551:343-945(+)